MTHMTRTDRQGPPGEASNRAESDGLEVPAKNAGVVEAQWDESLADELIQKAVARVGRAYDLQAPGCPVDGPGWDEAEARVDDSCAMHSFAALRASLDGYEQHARDCFGGWAKSSRE